MLRRTLMAGLVLAPLFLSACEDKDTSGPQGTNGQVTVRAYVDSDGSGTFTAGDTPISGSVVTLTNTQTEVATPATTDAQGIATFASVTPGSYAASFSGTVPTGAVLASATKPVVVIPFKGGEVSSEFRYVLNPGSISGQLYRDNNANNVFDAGDTPAPGQTVTLYSGTDTLATPFATTTTDNNGVFTFATLRPGLYTVKISAIPTIQIVGGTTQQITVGAETAAAVPVKFTGNLISTIAAARVAAPGSTVAVEGVVTVPTGAFNGRSMYVQDATGGISVFPVDTAVIKPRVGHHGANNAIFDNGFNGTSSWLAHTTPNVSIISANGTSHPRINALSALLGTPQNIVYCTNVHGTITIRVTRAGAYTVTPEKNANSNCVPGSTATT